MLRVKVKLAKIKKHFQTQTANQKHRISRIHIRKESGKRRIFEMNYKDWRTDGNPELDLLFHEDGASRYLVKADISTCFPSIYSHSIPWALVGKETAKKNHRIAVPGITKLTVHVPICIMVKHMEFLSGLILPIYFQKLF